jgi:hypothetical protein
MDIFASRGPAGVGVAYASFAVLNALIQHLEASGALIPADVKKILDNALRQIPDDRNAAREDARRFIEGLKR